ncbi:MAG: hypothetical protein ACLGH0_01575, partial [Thermoanaerobaculia bacterium]
PQSSSFKLHVIYPDTVSGNQLRADIDITGATVGSPMSVEIARGSRLLLVQGANANPQVREVPQTPLRVLGAAQDLHLNEHARLVAVLFNRPITFHDANKLRDQIALTINVPKANYSITRRNTPTVPPAEPKPLQIPAAALQQDARFLNITFDKALSPYANYEIDIDAMRDMVTGTNSNLVDIKPRIDNNKPGAILTGRVLLGDNPPVPGAEVVLTTERGPQMFEVTDELGRFMYEFVARDIDSAINGSYNLRAIAGGRETKVEGAVRLIGEVHTVNLVYLGRGRAFGRVTYDDGEPIPNRSVTIGSTLFGQFRSDMTDEDGRYEVGDLPVGPITFSVADEDGRITYAAGAIRTAGEVVEQDLVIQRRAFPGIGTVRVRVRRSDTGELVPGAHVGVYTQGYALVDAYTDEEGFAEFKEIPAGLISIIGANFWISRESVGIEMEMRADQVVEQTLIIPVPPPTDGYAIVEGIIERDDPTAPGDRTKDQRVAGAILTIGNLPPVTANADGSYTFPDVPSSASGKKMLVFDPTTGRKGIFVMPTLVVGQVNRFSVRLSSMEPEGEATIRVRLTSATGEPVNGYAVMEPGFPPERFAAKGNGVYELTGVPVPMKKMTIVAVPTNRDGPYGEQMVKGEARADFAGQVVIVDLRLPGQGTIITRLELRQPDEACSTTPPCYNQAFGKVAVGYAVWDDTEQTTKVRTDIVEADPSTQLNTFRKIPARQEVAVYTDRHPAGYAGVMSQLAFEGDVRNITLRMDTIGDVTGRVFAYDRQTPVAGALVKLVNNKVIYGTELTKPDGSFRFAGVAGDLSFQVIAEITQDGIHRKGFVDGTTPKGGGPVSNLRIIMREQSTIEGQVVDLDGNPVPLARFWARELAWPNREFGDYREPLQADINGRFVLTNIFTGPFRITAIDPVIQEKRGDYQGELRFEADTSQMDVKVRIGGIGFGDITVLVVDPLQALKPIENAEVSLYRNGGKFDLTSTDDRGIAVFRDVPAGNQYSVGAYSKAVGRAGTTPTFSLADGGDVHQQIVLELLGRVAGFVTDPEGTPVNKPVVGMPVQLESGAVYTRDSTDGVGAFEILGVPEGPFKLFAYDYDTGRMA